MTSLITRVGLTELAASQSNRHILVNTNDVVALMLSTAAAGKDTTTPPGSPAEGDWYIVGYGATGDWSAYAGQSIAYYNNGAWANLTPIDRLMAFVNSGGTNATLWQYDATGSPTGWGQITLSGAAASSATPYDVPVVFGTTPTSGQVIARYTCAREIDFPANFASSVGSVETNPDSVYAIDVQDDAVSIGTLSISTGGVYTFTTTSGTAKTVAAGSKLEFVAPTGSPTETSITGISAMLRGSTTDTA